ncbi:SNF5-domain-containing protein [Peniophora sp. CONT]|nr:SNF5-domain-containing protein [Peniophora sp. CONT]
MTANVKVGNLTDLQLRQQISQLSASQYSGYSNVGAPQPQRIATPTAASSTTRRSHSAVPPPPAANTAAAPAVNYAPAAVRRPAGPVLPTTPQAVQTTYGSRMRTGATLLMQPILGGSSSNTTAAQSSTRTRRGGVVSYTEPGSGDEMPDAGELDSDGDTDFVASGGLRTSVRNLRGAAGPTGTPRAAPAGPPPPKSGELEQSYLGGIPPARFISAKPATATRHDAFSEEQLLVQANQSVAPVPIRVEFETDTHRIRDCFVWDARERLLTPETFARAFCADLDLAPSWADTVAAQIRAQLEESEQIAGVELAVDGTLAGTAETPECRVILSIDVQIDNYHLLDHIEWDLRSPLTPEVFATQLCRELGLAGEAVPLVAHAVHEELLKHKKDALEWGVLGGSSENSANPALDAAIAPGAAAGMIKDKTGLGMGWSRAPREVRGPRVLRSVWRDWQEAEEFGTRWEELTVEEIERREVERERASRRLRRETSKFQSSTRTRTRR